MPRKLIKKTLPDASVIMKSKLVSVFGNILKNPSLWHINRRSCAGAVAVGLFCAFIPLPFQMFIAASLAIIFRVNILISVVLVWITNPITIPPFFYFCYRVGAYVLGVERGEFSFELSFDWLVNSLAGIWQPFLLGCSLVGTFAALIGFFAIQFFWRYQLWQYIKVRHSRNKD